MSSDVEVTESLSCNSILAADIGQCNKMVVANGDVESGVGLGEPSGMVVANGDVTSEAAAQDVTLKDDMLDHLSLSEKAHFESQQIGDPELTAAQKRGIAQSVLQRSSGRFLARFGRYLKVEHLGYFNCSEDYEVKYHVRQLQRFYSKQKNQVDVKNRRYEALKKLVSEGSYFSDGEMRKRNPLLYERLIGRYLTAREIEDHCQQERDSINSLVNLFLAQIERKHERNLRQMQLDAEEGAIEEVDTSDEDSDDAHSSEEEPNNDSGEDDEEGEETPVKKRRGLSSQEKQLLRDEFVTSMYQSFLDGNDLDFDYSEVDLNPEYDSLKVRGEDEEEKYFDCETPEEAAEEETAAVEDKMTEDSEEDELDRFMRQLKPEPTPTSLADDLQTTSLDKTP